MKYKTKQKLLRITSRASTISGCLSFLLGFYSLDKKYAIPIAIILNLISFIISFLIAYVPETVEDLVDFLRDDKLDLSETFSEKIQQLQYVQTEITSYISDCSTCPTLQTV